MTFDPLTERYDLVVTTKDKMEEGLRLMSGYYIQEYHVFESPESATEWISMNAQKDRTKILFFCEKIAVASISPEYYHDMCSARPCFYGLYTREKPAFLLGEFAVYARNLAPYKFPIYKTNGDRLLYLVVSNTTQSTPPHVKLCRAIHVDYIPKVREDVKTGQLRIVL